MYIVLALLGALFAAITAITGKVALQKVSPLWVASIKTFIMSALLITVSFIYFKGEIGTLEWKIKLWIAIVIFLILFTNRQTIEFLLKIFGVLK